MSDFSEDTSRILVYEQVITWEEFVNFLFLNNIFLIKGLHPPRYYYGVLSMNNQKRNKLLSAKTNKTNLPPWMPDHIDFTEKYH